MQSNPKPTIKEYCTWRRTKDGEWVVMGLATIVKPNATVKVRRFNGGIDKVTVVEVGRDFQLEPDGDTYRYGYLTERKRENDELDVDDPDDDF